MPFSRRPWLMQRVAPNSHISIRFIPSAEARNPYSTKGRHGVESGLVNALEKESEVLQNITDQFAPLMPNFRIFFFWEQEKTDLKYKRDYVVEETSAAPILDNTERCGIGADHQGMCKFHSPADQGFRTAMAALRRYTRDAPSVIQRRYQRSANLQRDEKMLQAAELLETVPARVPGPCQNVLHTLGAPDSVYFGKAKGSPSCAQQGSNLKDCMALEG
ncbi:hypothetical protein BDV12DRAFT_47 [Aspergillus spectabilis]